MGLFCSKYSSSVRLDGKTVIVTGANRGIGKCTAEDFYKRGARVIMACRNVEKAKEIMADIKEASKHLEDVGTILVTELDLANLNSVKHCAARLTDAEESVDILVNNAGVLMDTKRKTKDGFEMDMGTNHLGHFYFTLLLLPTICQNTPARIVNVSSMSHRGDRIDFNDLNWEKKEYDPLKAYQQSKLANILFAKELAVRLKENNVSGVTCYAVHPGCVKTDLPQHIKKVCVFAKLFFWFFSWILKTPERGAETIIYCAVDEACANETGLYYADCTVKKPSKAALNDEDAKRLWNTSWEMVGLDVDFNPFPETSVWNKFFR